jgi:hypothetical protein
MTAFTQVSPSLENYWRAIILFGRNVASYKFALGKSLLEAARAGKTFVPIAELARPFAGHIAQHLKLADKQATSRSSQFLDSCRKFNRGELTEEQLAEATVRLGFNNVIDAFHVVGPGEIQKRFFTDERASPQNGIRLTDDLFRLTEQYQHRNLPYEIEARWRLVETAWELTLPATALVVAPDDELKCLVTDGRHGRRKAITSCRHALNGYQKGKCFYCFGDISLVEGADDLADVGVRPANGVLDCRGVMPPEGGLHHDHGKTARRAQRTAVARTRPRLARERLERPSLLRTAGAGRAQLLCLATQAGPAGRPSTRLRSRPPRRG